jgi:hypothetical protein
MKTKMHVVIAWLASGLIALSYWLGYRAGNAARASNARGQFVLNSHPWSVNSSSASPRLMYILPLPENRAPHTSREAEPTAPTFHVPGPESPRILPTSPAHRRLPPTFHTPSTNKQNLILIDDTAH